MQSSTFGCPLIMTSVGLNFMSQCPFVSGNWPAPWRSQFLDEHSIPISIQYMLILRRNSSLLESETNIEILISIFEGPGPFMSCWDCSSLSPELHTQHTSIQQCLCICCLDVFNNELLEVPHAFFSYFSCFLSINTYIYIHHLHVIFLKHIKTVYSYPKQLTQQLCAGPQWNSYLKRSDIWLYNQNGQVLYFFSLFETFFKKEIFIFISFLCEKSWQVFSQLWGLSNLL